MEKKCTKCGEVKSLDKFYNHKIGKNGKDSRCRTCVKDYREANKEKSKQYKKEYYKKNKEKFSQHAKEYYKKKKEKILLQSKEYNKKNKEKRKEYSKIYRQNNKEKEKKRLTLYRKKNKDKILLYRKKNKGKKREYLKKYLKERRKTDFLFRLRGNISANIKESLKKQGYSKKTKTYNILKCDFNFFMKWINSIASNGHTYGIGELHLDHVIPISLAETEKEALLLNHYSNLQLLTADENFSKGNRYVNPLNLARVLEHHPNPDKIREIHARL